MKSTDRLYFKITTVEKIFVYCLDRSIVSISVDISIFPLKKQALYFCSSCFCNNRKEIMIHAIAAYWRWRCCKLYNRNIMTVETRTRRDWMKSSRGIVHRKGCMHPLVRFKHAWVWIKVTTWKWTTYNSMCIAWNMNI